MKRIVLDTQEAVTAAVDAGRAVYWSNDGYRVVPHALGYMLKFTGNGYMSGCNFTPFDFSQGFYAYTGAE